jgi:hypothetical protein
MGLAPTGKRRLFTAHAVNGHFADRGRTGRSEPLPTFKDIDGDPMGITLHRLTVPGIVIATATSRR